MNWPLLTAELYTALVFGHWSWLSDIFLTRIIVTSVEVTLIKYFCTLSFYHGACHNIVLLVMDFCKSAIFFFWTWLRLVRHSLINWQWIENILSSSVIFFFFFFKKIKKGKKLHVPLCWWPFYFRRVWCSPCFAAIVATAIYFTTSHPYFTTYTLPLAMKLLWAQH